MGCNRNSCRPYRAYDFDRRKDRDFFCDSPYGPPCRGRRYYRDDFRNRPSGGNFFRFPHFF
jgi:hypothetical protein